MGLFSRLLNGKRRIDASQVVLNILNNCVKNGVTAGPQQELPPCACLALSMHSRRNTN